VLQKNYDATTGIPINESNPNPMRRDTLMVPPGGSATLRFRADNPGVWFLRASLNLHLARLNVDLTLFIDCHIEWHLEASSLLTSYDMTIS
jgi:hypothetical protein